MQTVNTGYTHILLSVWSRALLFLVFCGGWLGLYGVSRRRRQMGIDALERIFLLLSVSLFLVLVLVHDHVQEDSGGAFCELIVVGMRIEKAKRRVHGHASFTTEY